MVPGECEFQSSAPSFDYDLASGSVYSSGQEQQQELRVQSAPIIFHLLAASLCTINQLVQTRLAKGNWQLLPVVLAVLEMQCNCQGQEMSMDLLVHQFDQGRLSAATLHGHLASTVLKVAESAVAAVSPELERSTLHQCTMGLILKKRKKCEVCIQLRIVSFTYLIECHFLQCPYVHLCEHSYWAAQKNNACAVEIKGERTHTKPRIL